MGAMHGRVAYCADIPSSLPPLYEIVRPRQTCHFSRARAMTEKMAMSTLPVEDENATEQSNDHVIEKSSSKRQTAAKICSKCCGCFPEVEPVPTEEIMRNRNDYILVDVRSSDERAVSIIPGAVTKAEFMSMATTDEIKGKKIVPYCTIGYRSGAYGKYLIENGFSRDQVRNGEGILLWTHHGGALVCRGATGAEVGTTQVHTYGKQWDLAPEGTEAVQFGLFGMFWEGLKFKLFG